MIGIILADLIGFVTGAGIVWILGPYNIRRKK